MQDLVIQPEKEGKGRAFTATLISYVCADGLWEPGSVASTENRRPVWMMLGGSDNELRPFVANLRLGRKAKVLRGGNRPEQFEILKSAEFQSAWQRTPIGTVVTLFAPDLFRLDPGMVDPKGIEFCLLPAREWLTGVTVDDRARSHLTSLDYKVPEDRVEALLRAAPLFAAYLDRRTRCPLIPDQRFYAQILAGALSDGLASWSDNQSHGYYNRPFGSHRIHGFTEYETANAGLAPGVAFRSSHSACEEFLAGQVALYFERVKESA